MSTSTDFLCLTISAGKGVAKMNERGQYRRQYRVTVKSDATGARIGFTYHDSIHNYDKGVVGLDSEGLLYAFWAFVMDAQAGEESFDDFANDFGYEEDSYSARQVHKACQDARKRLARLFHEDRDPAWVLDMLSAQGIE